LGVGIRDGGAVMCGVGVGVATVLVGEGVDCAAPGTEVAVAGTVVGRMTGAGVDVGLVAAGAGSEFGRGAFGVGVGADCVAVGVSPAGSSAGSTSGVAVGVTVTTTVSSMMIGVVVD
jgi:hypothetical protein